jgi:hypothetical protein
MLQEITNPLSSSELIFPTLECLHIAGFVLSVGTIAIVDFRLLGLGMRRHPVAEIARGLAPWTLVGLVLMLTSGPLLFSSDPDEYYVNRSFQIKMVLLLLAIVFHYTVHRKAAASGKSSAWNKIVACVSMGLWVGVVFCGIFIAFV